MNPLIFDMILLFAESSQHGRAPRGSPSNEIPKSEFSTQYCFTQRRWPSLVSLTRPSQHTFPLCDPDASSSCSSKPVQLEDKT